MAFNEKLAEKIRDCLKFQPNITERKMFGGLCFMFQGNMLCGIVGNKLMLRVGPEQYEHCLSLKHTTKMDFTGRPMKGMIYVNPEGFKTNSALNRWIDRALEFVSLLPAK